MWNNKVERLYSGEYSPFALNLWEFSPIPPTLRWHGILLVYTGANIGFLKTCVYE